MCIRDSVKSDDFGGAFSPLRASCFPLPKSFRVTENTACCVPNMKCSPDTRDCPLRRQSRHSRRPARRGVTVKTGIGSRDKDTGLCNPLYTSRQRRPMPNLRQTVPRMFAAARSGCRRVFLCRCGQSAMIRCDDSLPTYGKRIGAYVQTHDTYGRSIYPYRKIYGQSITVYARTYGRTIPMQASQYRHAGMKAWRHGGIRPHFRKAPFPYRNGASQP